MLVFMTSDTDFSKSIPAHALREADAARYLAVSRAYLRSGRMHGRGPAFVRIGRAVVYRVTDLDCFLDQHRVETRNP